MKLAKSIYRFFRNVCASPKFTLSEWMFLSHDDSMENLKNQRKEGKVAGDNKKQ